MIVQHHVKYKEIHGVDEIIDMSWSDHQKLHRKLRKNGKCNIPSDQLGKIAHEAHSRTDKFVNSHRIASKRYAAKNIHTFNFRDTLMKNVFHHETISYNYLTGIASICCNFRADHGTKLFYIDI